MAGKEAAQPGNLVEKVKKLTEHFQFNVFCIYLYLISIKI